MVPQMLMKSFPQDPIQRPRRRRNPPLRSDLSGSGKTSRRERVAVQEQQGAKSRFWPRPPLSKTRQHGAAPENASRVAPGSEQTVSTAPSVLKNEGSGAGEPHTKKPILQPASSAQPLTVAIDQLWQVNRLQKLLPLDWGAITLALLTLSARLMANPVHATTLATNLSLKLWRESAETWIGAISGWWGLASASISGKGL